jgi:hypothetical protein
MASPLKMYSFKLTTSVKSSSDAGEQSGSGKQYFTFKHRLGINQFSSWAHVVCFFQDPDCWVWTGHTSCLHFISREANAGTRRDTVTRLFLQLLHLNNSAGVVSFIATHGGCGCEIMPNIIGQQEEEMPMDAHGLEDETRHSGRSTALQIWNSDDDILGEYLREIIKRRVFWDCL